MIGLQGLLSFILTLGISSSSGRRILNINQVHWQEWNLEHGSPSSPSSLSHSSFQEMSIRHLQRLSVKLLLVHSVTVT